ncbi:hemolysin family protein [Candidatus Endowatersipora endosymbiont of Watersipora subatra]|uniref:hemolysin family protein n=1 Tax=Candidatus Endowatersipora endosymbiont of Watersipora subatra TaxID=3077946 RepID=UPI00312C7827
MKDRSSKRVSLEVKTTDDHSCDDDNQSIKESSKSVGCKLIIIEYKKSLADVFKRFLINLRFFSDESLRENLNEALSGKGSASHVFTPEERAMLQNIMHLREKRVVDIMVPRAEIEAVEGTIRLGELLHRFEETRHSRLPVYNETLDDPKGMILIKDLLLYMTTLSSYEVDEEERVTKKRDLTKINLETPLSKIDILRSVLFVPPSMLAADLMARMQANRTQMALVIDEYGGTDGLVSLEDIVEEVVGEIEDEHDSHDDLIEVSGEGLWIADARLELEKLTKIIGSSFNSSEYIDDIDTLGGLVFALAGHIPVRGEVVSGIDGFEFRILDADPRRIKRIQIVQMSLGDRRRKSLKEISF